MNTDTIQIWHGNIAAEEAHYQTYWSVLGAAEQAHAETMKNDLLRKRYVFPIRLSWRSICLILQAHW